MAITTMRAKRASRWPMVRGLIGAVVAISILHIFAPSASMAQVAVPSKKQLHPQRRAAAKVNPNTAPSPTDNEADELNQKWLSDYNKGNGSNAPASAVAPSVPGTETERTLSAPTQASLPGAAARQVLAGSVTYVKADSTSAAFNSMPGGANQPLFKDLSTAFAGFSANGGAKIEMMQARTADGSPRVIYASIGDGKSKRSYWWFSPPDQPEGWFDESGKRLGGAAFTEPKPGARISSPFGTRRYYGRVTSHAFHNGIDFEAHYGEPILAAADGVVNHANWYYNYGRTVKITHSDHLETLYAHMSQIAVGITPGTVIHKGDVIGYVGATGRSSGPHLHFSVIKDGQFVDPQPYLSGNGNSTLVGADLVAYRQWQQDVRAAAIAQPPTQRASFWSRNPFTPPPSPGQL